MIKNKLIALAMALLLCLSVTSCAGRPVFNTASPEQMQVSQSVSQAPSSSQQESFESSSEVSSLITSSEETNSAPSASTPSSSAPSSSVAPPAPSSQPSATSSSAVSSKPATLEESLTQISATHAFVYDNKREVLFVKGKMNARVYPASITKLYTAYVALQYLDPAAVVQAGDELKLLAADSSVASIQKGNRLTVEMLLQGMLLPSGNDAAYVIAAAAGRVILEQPDCDAKKAVAAFVDTMNRHAQSDGLTGTKFANPDGYHHKNHYSCMSDLLTVAKLALKTPMILKYTGQDSAQVTFESGETRTWKNTNALLHMDSEYYRSGIIGLKTGFTGPAGHCLITAAVRGNALVMVGVFQAVSSKKRFEDTVTLLDAYPDLLNAYDAQTSSKAA